MQQARFDSLFWKNDMRILPATQAATLAQTTGYPGNEVLEEFSMTEVQGVIMNKVPPYYFSFILQ